MWWTMIGATKGYLYNPLSIDENTVRFFKTAVIYKTCRQQYFSRINSGPDTFYIRCIFLVLNSVSGSINIRFIHQSSKSKVIIFC